MAKPGRPLKPNAAPSYMGGHTKMTGCGYILERCPSHPRADRRGYVPQHRLVTEARLGRFLLSGEVVHHADRNRLNNNWENLRVVSRVAHVHLHMEEDGMPWACSLTEDQVRSALRGRTTEQAARLLGVHHMTLRNRFDHLLIKRRSPHWVDDPEAVAAVRRAAPDPAVGFRELARMTGICNKTATSICRLHGIEWIHKTASPRL